MGKKGICVRIEVITSASSDVGCLKESLKKMGKSIVQSFSASKSKDAFFVAT